MGDQITAAAIALATPYGRSRSGLEAREDGFAAAERLGATVTLAFSAGHGHPARAITSHAVNNVVVFKTPPHTARQQFPSRRRTRGRRPHHSHARIRSDQHHARRVDYRRKPGNRIALVAHVRNNATSTTPPGRRHMRLVYKDAHGHAIPTQGN